MSNKKQGMPQLDGLRGIAVLLVLFSHAANVDYVLFENFRIAGNGSGKIGVWLFFVLSAFLLTNQMLNRSVNGIFTKSHLKTYCKRRFLRIFPLFAVAIAFLIAANLSAPSLFTRFGNFDISDGLKHLFLIEERAHFWTIATEVQFYFFIPLIAYGFLACKNSIFKAVAGTLVLCILSLALDRYIDKQSGHTVFYYFPIFLCGSFSAFLFKLYPNGFFKSFASKTGTLFCILWGLVMTACLPQAFLMISDIQQVVTHPVIFSLWSIFFGSTILYLLWYEQTLLTRIISHRLFALAGYISFSLYVWHFILLDIIRTTLPDSPTIIQAALFYGSSFVVASISYLWIERPLMQRKMPLKIAEN